MFLIQKDFLVNLVFSFQRDSLTDGLLPLCTVLKNHQKSKTILLECLFVLDFFTLLKKKEMNFVKSNNLSLKYQKFTPSGCKYIGILKTTKFLSYIFLTLFCV